MPWLLLDVVLVLLGLAVLGFTGLSLWRAVTGLGREVAQAGRQVGEATDALAALQAQAPAARHAGSPVLTPSTRPGGRPDRRRR